VCFGAWRGDLPNLEHRLWHSFGVRVLSVNGFYATRVSSIFPSLFVKPDFQAVKFKARWLNINRNDGEISLDCLKRLSESNKFRPDFQFQ
jgi:hypothetical protein